MNKKTLIITTGALLLSCVLVGVLFYLQTFKTVHFDMKRNDVSVTIFNKDDQEITKFNKTSDVRLQPGDYTLATIGEKYDNTPTRFSVGETDSTVVVNPTYSAAYRDKILTAELPAITKVLTDEYPTVMPGFIIGKGEIYNDGLWYATTLTQVPPTPVDQGDIYRTVLKKEEGVWVMKTKPAIALSIKEYPDIPKDILSDINTKGGE